MASGGPAPLARMYREQLGALVTLRASQGGFGVLRKLGPRGLSGPAGGEENFEIALLWCFLSIVLRLLSSMW